MPRNNRDRILATAARLFREKGYDATSMADISEAVGVQKSSIYHYFESKEDLLNRIIDRSLGSALKSMEEVALLTLPPAQKLARGVETHMASVEAHLDAMTVLLREDRSVRPPWRDSYIAGRDRYENVFKQIVKEGIEKGEFRRVDVNLATKALLGMCNWAAVWYKEDGNLTARELAGFFADLVLHGLVDEAATGLPSQRPARKRIARTPGATIPLLAHDHGEKKADSSGDSRLREDVAGLAEAMNQHSISNGIMRKTPSTLDVQALNRVAKSVQAQGSARASPGSAETAPIGPEAT